MSIAARIRNRVQRLLSGAVDLDDFEDWFLANTWNAHLREDAQTVALVHKIEGLLLDYSAEAIGYADLRLSLSALLPRSAEPTFYFREENVTPHSSSARFSASAKSPEIERWHSPEVVHPSLAWAASVKPLDPAQAPLL